MRNVGKSPRRGGHFPTLPHESIVSVFCPHERTVRESSILRRCRTLSNPSLFLGHSTPRIQASFSDLPVLCRVLFNNHPLFAYDRRCPTTPSTRVQKLDPSAARR